MRLIIFLCLGFTLFTLSCRPTADLGGGEEHVILEEDSITVQLDPEIIEDSSDTTILVDSVDHRAEYTTEIDSILAIDIQDTFSIDLGASLSTGKLWLLQDSSSIVSIINTKQRPAKASSEFGDIQEFQFVANESGVDSLVFIYQRPFGKNLGEKRIFTQYITVKQK